MPRTKTAVKRSRNNQSHNSQAEGAQAQSGAVEIIHTKSSYTKSSQAQDQKAQRSQIPNHQTKSCEPRAAEPLTPEQQQEQRSQAARKAALARWSKERPPSKRELRQQLSRVPSSDLTVEHYADRANPELSWAAAILKRGRSGENQRKKAAEIMSRYGVPKSRGKLAAYLKALPPEQRHEIAQRAGRRRWEIWREEQARLQGRNNFRAA
jgi:hypothetical protein